LSFGGWLAGGHFEIAITVFSMAMLVISPEVMISLHQPGGGGKVVSIREKFYSDAGNTLNCKFQIEEKNMNTKKIWANLAVKDVEKTWDFYLKLGFKPNCPPSTQELASFVVGDDDFVIHFFEKDRFKPIAEGEIADLRRGNEIMFTLSAESKSEVDRWVEEINKAGGTVLFDPKKDRKKLYDENGYYVCVFTDPDGHKFNVFYNPHKQ
jgi:hypothetical protein